MFYNNLIEFIGDKDYINNNKASPRVAQTHATEGGPLTLGTHTIGGRTAHPGHAYP